MKILAVADEECKALWDYFTPDKLEGVELIIACGDLSRHYLEQATMATHAEYWSAHLATGQAILFGPVLDPAGVWGLLALEVRSEQELNALKDADPALAGIPGMRWEVMPFLTAMARPHAA